MKLQSSTEMDCVNLSSSEDYALFPTSLQFQIPGTLCSSSNTMWCLSKRFGMEDRNELRSKAERAGLPTFTVADAGRTQVRF